ncbi:MAG: hypothetical protein IE937_09035 [Gammaproteobacteria bacterium]|nr:hypothetical protein [Gammaproteobacteria bacterium]
MNRSINLSAVATYAGLMFMSGSVFAEPHPGKVLHDKAQCMSCHTAKPYNPQKTNSYPKLVKAVQFCNDNLNAGMWEEEVEQLADYLNQEYYHFNK